MQACLSAASNLIERDACRDAIAAAYTSPDTFAIAFAATVILCGIAAHFLAKLI